MSLRFWLVRPVASQRTRHRSEHYARYLRVADPPSQILIKGTSRLDGSMDVTPAGPAWGVPNPDSRDNNTEDDEIYGFGINNCGR